MRWERSREGTEEDYKEGDGATIKVRRYSCKGTIKVRGKIFKSRGCLTEHELRINWAAEGKDGGVKN